jgi:probable F420-dependent oxidoreductase
MTRVKIGITLHPQHMSAPEYLQAWRYADELGVDSIWNWDHFFPLSGDLDGPAFEGWTALTAGAMQTSRAQVGNLVLSITYRNPALLSAMARTLDHLTGGRLILGLGAGWFERDYREYGYEFGPVGNRLRELERGIETIKARWERDAPKPLRGTIPILIGGGGEKVTLRIVAQHADLWHGFGPPETWRYKNAVLNTWCHESGRPPSAIERIASIGDESAHAPIADMREHYATLEGYVEAGAHQILYGLGAPFNFRPVEALMRWRDDYGGS